MTCVVFLLATVVHWAVPPLSDEMRLPDAEPTDGVKGGTVRIVAAQDEYEPGSFVVRSDADLGKVSFALTPFVRADGTVFPAEALDLKLVKVWCQNKNGWFTYFGDVGGFKLVPELLLNDEDLVRVDAERMRNYARLVGADGTVTEKWINPPHEQDRRPGNPRFDTFYPMRPDFRDAATLQPVCLDRGVCRQFFLTAHVGASTSAGVYRGKVKGTAANGVSFDVPVELTVLDFQLPKPKCFADPGKDFWVCFYSYISLDYIKAYNGGDHELAKRQLEATLRDQVAHGQDMHWFRSGLASNGMDVFDSAANREEFLFTLGTMEKVGMRTKPLVGWVIAAKAEKGGREATVALAKRRAAQLDALIGHHDVYLGYGDEPDMKTLLDKHRPVEKWWQEAGFRFILAGGPHVFRKNGHLLDWHNINASAERDELPRLWNVIGGDRRIAWYSGQHVGAEDPALSRRQNGLVAWLSGYTALCNYAHHYGPWNDDKPTYRPMVYAYGISNGVVDTIQWEGFREGIDDIRYGTLLVSLAREAELSGDLEVQRLGRKALRHLALFDKTRGDLDEMRMEMVGFIVDLRKEMGK